MSEITDSNKIKLRFRYWDCRGRVQAIRYMLEDIAATHKNVDYKEDFELISTLMNTWPSHKSDPTISGPFGTLPVLKWNDTHIFGETLTIAHILARKFNLYGKVTSSNNDPIFLEGDINSVVSCAYIDIMVPLLMTIWSKPNLNDKTSLEYYAIQRSQAALQSLNTLLKKSSTSFFFDQTEPTVADYFAFDAYISLRDIYPQFIPNNCEEIIKLEQIMKERPALANYFENGRLFKRFTAAPDEAEYFAKIASIK